MTRVASLRSALRGTRFSSHYQQQTCLINNHYRYEKVSNYHSNLRSIQRIYVRMSIVKRGYHSQRFNAGAIRNHWFSRFNRNVGKP